MAIDEQPISLDSTPVEQPISLDTGVQNNNYLLSPEMISQRSFKAAYAISNTPAAKPQSEIQDIIQQGKESSLREDVASSLNSDAANKRYNLMSTVLANKQGPVTPDDMKAVDTASGYNFPYKYPLDPSSVFEVNYGKQYASELTNFSTKLGDNNFWNYGQIVARNDIEAAQIFGDVTTAQHQYLTTKAQDAQAKMSAQSGVGYAADFAKIYFPVLNPYYEAKMRGNVPGVGILQGGVLGENLEAQRIKLHQLPFEQFTQVVDTVYDKLAEANPQAAIAWVGAMMGQSTSERALNNINTVAQFLDVPIIFNVGKVAHSRLALINNVNNAVKTALKSSIPLEATKANILSSVGDLKAAAVESAKPILADRVSGNVNPTREALEVLPENFNIFKNDITGAPNLSQAHQNILLEQTDGAISRGLQMLTNTLRPTRVNLEDLSGEVLYKVQKTIVDRYPSDNASIFQISNPIQELVSKTYYSTVRWGKEAGELFSNYHEAADAALQKGFRVTYDKPQLAELNARIASVKDDLKAGPDIHADTAGLNYYHSLPDTLKSLEEKYAAVSKPGGATIGQRGLGYFIERNIPYRETEKRLLDLVANPDNPLAVSPDSWTKHIPYLNYLRTAEDTFSPEARANRKAALYPQATFLAMVKEEGKILSDFIRGAVRNDPVTGELNPFYKRGIPLARGIMNKGRLKEFNRVLDYSQNEAKDPVTKQTGYYFTPTELNDHYLRTFERPATFEETQAYEAVKRWDELQRVFTQTMVYRNEARLGNEAHTLKFKTPEGNEGRSQEFVGAIRNTFPRGRGTIMVMGEDTKSSSVLNMDRMSVKAKDDMVDLIKTQNYKLIQLQYPDRLPFKDLGVKNGDRLIHYVLTPNVESNALKWDSVPRVGGGRHVYDYTHYLKIPNMKFEPGKSNYMGDITIAPVGYKSLGEDVAKKYNVVRRLIEAGDDVKAKASFINNGLEGALEPWNKFRSKFNRFKDEAGTWHDPIYSSKVDMRVVPRNKSIMDLDKSLEKQFGSEGSGNYANTWRDATRENNPGKNFQVAFTGERDAVDLQAIENKGTAANPIYGRTPAQKIDPLSMLNRGMRSTINSLFMDDYKTYAVNSWLKEASGKLKDPDSVIWSSPFATFKTATKDSFKSGTGPEEIGRLMANHFKIDQLVGTPTVFDTFVHSIAQNLADAAYRKLGPTAASYVVPSWLIPKLRDPFAFMRAVTFNAYLGLFSVPQILVQSMTYVNMWAISPKYATQGTLGAYLHYLSALNRNPEILNHLDKIASKFGFKPGEFIESMNELHNSGFAKVGPEQGLLSNMHRNNIIQNGVDRFLEWGRKPFQWGEQNSRIGAWYTAMKEFRDANPSGRLTDTDRAKILDRADFYYGNMSTASHSAMNAGVLSLPTQFYMYTTRLAEMFWSGSRLGGTLAERNLARARLVGINAGMFGVPMALGVTGLPVSDYLRKELLENGYMGTTPPYIVGKNFVESLINEGVMAGAIAAATGKWYNFGPREGLGGVTPLKDIYAQDAKFWKIAGGASASLTMNVLNNGIEPLFHQLFQGNYKNVKLEDIMDVFKEVQTVNSGWSWWVAMNTGKWINKNSDYISDTSKTNASFMFLSGLREPSQADVWNKESTIKDRDDLQKYALKQFALQMNRSLIAASNKDPEQAQAFRDKAIAWLPASDFPPEKLGQAIVRALKGVETLPDRINFEYYIQKAPQVKKEQLRKAFEYVRQNRGQ